VPSRDLIPLNSKQSLTPAEFNALSDIPPEIEWLANITNQETRRAYKVDVAEFIKFSGLTEIKSLQAVARSHVIACARIWTRQLAPASIRRKLSALSSLFQRLILLLGEFAIDAAAPILNGMREYVSHFKVPETITALD
jgi:integrase/recombinase XerD